ncbi:MAG: hypothetical protein O6761_07785 [Thaumarchaeota archaeon]|nr:hypothetical protein [Nitrososphaerota archaeon]
MSLRIDLDTNDYDVKMRLFRNVLPQFPAEAVKGSTGIIEKNMVQVVPVKTGTLRDSIKKSVSGFQGKVETTAGYGLFVDEDTKRHKIEGNPLLAFIWRGKITIRASVMHPGTTGQQFRRKTLDNSRQEIVGEIVRVYDQEVAR